MKIKYIKIHKSYIMNNIVFSNPDMSMFIGKIKHRHKYERKSIIKYPYTKFGHISVILPKNFDCKDNSKYLAKYLPSGICMPNNISISYVHSKHEEYFENNDITLQDHLQVINNILFVICDI